MNGSIVRNALRNASELEALRDGMPGRLREFRQSQDAAQGEFADRCGIPRPSYRDYEGGKSFPGSSALIQLQAQGLNVNWLLARVGPMLISDLAKSPPALNEAVLVGVVEAIENFLAERELVLPPTKKGELIALLYETCLPEGEARPAVMQRFLRLVA
jgi:transcriptional regulator with XRE-family HTH domain